MSADLTTKRNRILGLARELSDLEQALKAVDTPLSTDTKNYATLGKALAKKSYEATDLNELSNKAETLVQEARQTLDRYKKAATYWAVVMRQLESKRAAHPDLINLREQLANLGASMRHPNLTNLCKEGFFAMFMWVIRQHETILRNLEQNPEDTLDAHRYHLSQNADRFEWALEILGFDHTPATTNTEQIMKINIEAFRNGGLKHPAILRVLLEPRKLEIDEAFKVLEGYLGKE
jgi:DNA repair exonuclease SbcCD ATPase subunit